MRRISLAIVAVLALSGCTAWPGLQKSTQEPVHAESGFGVTIWKIPLVGIGGWGTAPYYEVPPVIIHRYEPPSVPYGAPPPPPR